MEGARCMSALLCMGLRSSSRRVVRMRSSSGRVFSLFDGSVDGNETTTGDWCLKGMCSAVR
jgi:hypothetical protein